MKKWWKDLKEEASSWACGLVVGVVFGVPICYFYLNLENDFSKWAHKWLMSADGATVFLGAITAGGTLYLAGRAAESAAIRGADRAAKNKEHDEERKKEESEKIYAMRMMPEISRMEKLVRAGLKGLEEFKYHDIPARNFFPKRILLIENILDQVIDKGLFDLNVRNLLMDYCLALQIGDQYYGYLEDSCQQYQNLVSQYTITTDEKSRKMLQETYNRQEIRVKEQLEETRSKLEELLNLVQKAKLKKLLERYKKD